MDNKELVELEKHAIPVEFPSLIKHITSKAVGDFHTNSNPQNDTITANGSEGIHIDSHEVLFVQATDHHFSHSISISLPTSPSFLAKQAKRVVFTDNAEKNDTFDERPKLADFHSQTVLCRNSLNTLAQDIRGSVIIETETVPRLDRCFNNKLEESELDALEKSENQPFLMRIPIMCFGICLGVSSQAILWKTLATSPSTDFLHVSLDVNIVLWCISLALIAIVSIFYILKIIFYFEVVQREYYHPIRVNFFFAPWIALLFLAIGAPPPVAVFLHSSLWYVLMVPILCLELKIYGQWMSGGQRRLSTIANPSNHLSIIGNFVGALLGSSMGLKEGPLFFFAVGLTHYTVLFVTLYQRLPTNETLPKELHPVFFLFVAAPSVACVAWEKIMDDFYIGSRIMYFIAMFLYFSLAVRINFFRGFRFSLAWWAYTFPMTSASIATIRYATRVRNPLTQALSLALSSVATITVTALFLLTIFHGFVLRDLFTNDISLATATSKKQSGDIEVCLSEEAS